MISRSQYNFNPSSTENSYLNDTPRAVIVSLKCAIRELVGNLDIEHTTIEVEHLGESCNLREKV